MSKLLKVYEISFSTWIEIFFLTFCTTFIWIGGLFFYFNSNIPESEIILYIIFIPIIILHLYYSICGIKRLLTLNKEKYTKLVVDKSQKELIFKGKDKLDYKLNFNDIKKIQYKKYIFMPPMCIGRHTCDLFEISVMSQNNNLYQLSVSDISGFKTLKQSLSKIKKRVK